MRRLSCQMQQQGRELLAPLPLRDHGPGGAVVPPLNLLEAIMSAKRSINSFWRYRTFSVLMRGNSIILGVIEEGARAGDLRISGDAGDRYLQVSRFDGAKWRQQGGFWDGRLHGLSVTTAEAVALVVGATRLNRFFTDCADQLVQDAKQRLQATAAAVIGDIGADHDSV